MNVSVHCKFFFLAVSLKFSIIKCWGENIHSDWWSKKRLKVSKAEKGTSWRLLQSQETSFCQQRSIWSKYGFSSNHIQMWQLDHKEGWALKNWCFRTVVLEKTRVPWTSRRANQSILKEINPEYSLAGLMLKCQHFGHLMRKEPTHWKRPWCRER